MVLLQKGEHDKAIATFRQVVALSPTYTAARFELGMALFKAGQLAEAAEQFRQAVESNSRFAPRITSYNVCYTKLLRALEAQRRDLRAEDLS